MTSRRVGRRANGGPTPRGSFTTWPLFVALFGLVSTCTLRTIRFRGGLTVGIIGTTVVATIINSATNHSPFGTPTAIWPGFGHLYAKSDFSILGNVSLNSFSSTQLGVIASTRIAGIDFHDLAIGLSAALAIMIIRSGTRSRTGSGWASSPTC